MAVIVITFLVPALAPPVGMDPSAKSLVRMVGTVRVVSKCANANEAPIVIRPRENAPARPDGRARLAINLV